MSRWTLRAASNSARRKSTPPDPTSEKRPRKRWWTSRAEWGPWEQKEGLRARIAELEVVVTTLGKRAQSDPERRDWARPFVAKAQEELDKANRALAHNNHPVMRRSAHLGVAQAHVDSALNMMVCAASAEDIRALLPQMVALVDEHLGLGDPQRIRVAEIAREFRDDPDRVLNSSERAFLAETVSLARRLLRKETLRVRSFVRIVRAVTLGVAIAVVAIAVLTNIWEDAVPLCFVPESKAQYRVVCPTMSGDLTSVEPTNAEIAHIARAQDYLLIEIAGMASAVIASAAALRRMRGTALPYDVPVVLACLKIPTGALTAVLGLLLMRGGFVPGLSALDSTPQIIAWALVFGYSQQLFTKWVDTQGQALLDAVHGPNSLTPPSPLSQPGPASL